MKVIMASYSKSGTKTIAKCLEILGYKNYDFEEHFLYHRHHWERIFKGEDPIPIFKEMYENVDAIMDLPTYHYWEQIAQAFPEAKILFVERDTEVWCASTLKMFKIINETRWANNRFIRNIMRCLIYPWSPTLFEFGRWMDKTFDQAVGLNHETIGLGPVKDIFNSTNLKNLYDRHNAHVLAKAPKDRFLYYKFSQGWEPLCQFLGEKIPAIDFPHSNKGGSIVSEVYEGGNDKVGRTFIENELKRRATIGVPILVILVALVFKVLI